MNISQEFHFSLIAHLIYMQHTVLKPYNHYCGGGDKYFLMEKIAKMTLLFV